MSRGCRQKSYEHVMAFLAVRRPSSSSFSLLSKSAFGLGESRACGIVPMSIVAYIVLVHRRFIEEPSHQFIDMLGDAGLGQSIADELPRALEFHGLGQFEGCSDTYCFRSGSGEFVMKWL